MLKLQAIHVSGMLCQRVAYFFQTTLAGMHLKANGAKKLYVTVVRKVQTWRGKQNSDDKQNVQGHPPRKD